MEAIERSVQEDGTFVDPVIQQYLKSAAGRHQKLMTFPVCMCPTTLPTRNIVTVKNTFYGKWQMYIIIDIRQTTFRERNLR